MATEFKCDYCTAAVEKNATLVHTERYHGLWDLDCSMCPDCFKHFKVMLEKTKSQKSWTGWTALEQEVASLKRENELLKSELQFLRHEDLICDQLKTADPHNELVTVVTKGGETLKAHRSILISRSAVFKTVLTSDEFKRQARKHNESAMIKLDLPTHPASFHAFIQFLYTAELKPDILKKHAPELMAAGNTYKIEMLTRKCEDYIVNNMTAESTIDYLKVAEQCKSTAITAAAVKQIQSNPTGFVNREDFQALKKNDPAAFLGAFQYIILDPTSGKKKEKKPKVKVSDPGSVPGSVTSVPAGSDPVSVSGSDPYINSGLPRNHRYEASHRSLGMCTCSVHPFAHSAAPGYEYHGVHFHAATPMPSTVHYVDPASVQKK